MNYPVSFWDKETFMLTVNIEVSGFEVYDVLGISIVAFKLFENPGRFKFETCMCLWHMADAVFER